MSWYKNNKTEWKEIIDTVSSEIKRNPLMVEKEMQRLNMEPLH